ncbi:MAG: PHP domain-containing protein [Gammaproteobacteria bacterium]|nr:PHP domain-containing protein [Gammaproteobacteria bacterium]
MDIIYDLHSHSTASDGTLTPTQLVQRAHEAGVSVLALTDHDSTEGITEAQQAASMCDLQLVPGAEISVTWTGRTIHIVALGINPHSPSLQQGLKKLVEFRHWRAEEIGRKLELKGIGGAYEAARTLSNGTLISRTHFARFLVEQGRAKDMRAVFRHYLVKGKPGHVHGEWASLDEAVGWIREAGGQAVIAHPARYRLTRTKLRKLIRDFRDAGGAALEVVSGSHSVDEAFTMAAHAKDYELLSSAGSDFHSPEQSWTELGRLPPLPHGCVPVWRDWGFC